MVQKTDDVPPELGPPPAPSAWQVLRAVPVTVLMTTLCAVLFIVAERAGDTRTIETLLQFGAVERSRVWAGEWWRLGSSMFLHVGVVHLVWNLTMGFRPSATVERALGSPRFLALWLLSGVVGSAFSVLGQDVVSAGASGALFGVLGGLLMLNRTALGGWGPLLRERGQRANLMLLAVWLAIGPFVGFDSFAHAGGLVAGAAITWAFLSPRAWKLLSVLGAAALTVGASLQPLPFMHHGAVGQLELAQLVAAHQWDEIVRLTETPRGETATMARVQALLALDRYDDARAVVRQADELAPYLSLFLAEWLMTHGRLDEALKQLDGLDVPLARSLEIFIRLEQGQVERALSLARGASVSERQQPLFKVAEAEVELARHHPDDAVRLALEAAALDARFEPQVVSVLLRVGRFGIAAKRLERVEDDDDQATLQCLLDLHQGALEAAKGHCTLSPHAEMWARNVYALSQLLVARSCGPAQTLPPTVAASVLQGFCDVGLGAPERAVPVLEHLRTTHAFDADVQLLGIALAEGDDEAQSLIEALGEARDEARASPYRFLLSDVRRAALEP